jgi:hypothetical protein
VGRDDRRRRDLGGRREHRDVRELGDDDDLALRIMIDRKLGPPRFGAGRERGDEVRARIDGKRAE